MVNILKLLNQKVLQEEYHHNKQIYKCFVCNDGGDIFKFVQKIEGIDFSTALEQLAERAGVKLEKTDFDPLTQTKKKIVLINELTAKFYHYLLVEHASGKVGLEYLKNQRGLKDETIKDWQLGFAPDTFDTLKRFLLKHGYTEQELLESGVISQSYNGTIDKFRGRIIFPFTGIDGKILGFNGRTIFNKDPKYLNTAETPVFHKSSFIYGLDKARVNIKKEGVVLVEGQMDVISAHQGGICNVVAATGTALTEGQLTLLSRYTTEITFCFDSDSAGSAAVYRAVDMAEKMNFNIKVSIIPKPYKDLDELVKNDLVHAKDTFNNAMPAYDFFLLDALKKNDKHTALGKKVIIDELTPLFSKLSNVVLLEHYAKKVANELDLAEETVLSLFKKTTTTPPSFESRSDDRFKEEAHNIAKIDYKTHPEGYLIALLFKANIDIQRDIAYKLHAEDFENSVLLSIYNSYLEYLQKDTKSFNIKSVEKSLSDEEKELVEELYLWDLDGRFDLENTEKLASELESTLKRIKKDAAKTTLKELTEKIKLAELGNDFEQVEKLSKKVERLKKLLI